MAKMTSVKNSSPPPTLHTVHPQDSDSKKSSSFGISNFQNITVDIQCDNIGKVWKCNLICPHPKSPAPYICSPPHPCMPPGGSHPNIFPGISTQKIYSQTPHLLIFAHFEKSLLFSFSFSPLCLPPGISYPKKLIKNVTPIDTPHDIIGQI